MVKLSIGLDFVKKNDTNWDKRLISIDQMDDKGYFEKSIYKYNENYEKSDTSNIEKKLIIGNFGKKDILLSDGLQSNILRHIFSYMIFKIKNIIQKIF